MRKHAWKNVLTIHGTYSVVPLLMGYKTARLAMAYYKRMDDVVAVSNFTKKYLSTRMPALADVARDVTVIHNAISLAGIAADTAPRPAGRAYSIVSVSAVKRKKGHLQSIRAIRRFLDAHPCEVTYDIVGNDASDPAFTKELLAETDALGLNGVVRLRGKISDADLDAAYRNADAFLLPSLQEDDYFEGFGLVFIEANARGTPSIGGDTGGCPEAIKEGVSGYVCDPENTEALAARLADVLVHGTIDRAACRAWAEEHDIDRRVADIETIYQS
jgi:phosphatidylinositol alpha-1,6-mannosyltransferase